MRTALTYILVVFYPLWLTACSVPEGALIEDCQSENGLEVVCGLQAPEDLAVVPGDRFLLLSQFGGIEGEGSGNILLFDTTDHATTQLFPDLNDGETSQDETWGDSACNTAPDERFSPHGTHLHQLSDGRWRYAVVNHGGREAVELFELKLEESPQLHWRGCVFPPANTVMNDVVGIADGDLFFTHMLAADDSLAMFKGLLGMNTGNVWHWNQQNGLAVLANTEGALPNGLEISADNRHLFINMYLGKQVYKYDLQTRSTVAVAEVPMADNSAWSPEGKLWLASHTGGMRETLACFEDQSFTCGAGFEIVELDPNTMLHKTVFSHRGPPMGAATIAVAAGDKVYMGSYAGDRLMIVPRERLH